MSKEAYDAILPEAAAMSADQLKTPYMPMGIFLQEAEDLYVWAIKDKDKLVASGLSETMLDRLKSATDATRYAQSLWSSEMQAKQDAQAQWQEQAPEAFDLRNQLLHTFRYAYRNNQEVLSVVDHIAEGGGNADMIQDLSDQAVLGRKHPEELTAINFDLTLIETADTLSGEMADLLAVANGEKQEANETLAIRNQLYTLLKDAVDEIRDCGKYAFWRDEKRLKGYSSRYNRLKS